MFRKSLPVGTLVMVLVVMLALLGVGYAFWSETLTIEGTVQTGEVDVKFSTYPPVECVDTPTGDCEDELPAKDGATTCRVQWLGPDGVTDGDNGPDQLVVTVTGMYPSYHCKVKFDVTNIGTVPVHVKLPEPTTDIPEWIGFENQCYEDGIQLHRGESTGVCTIDIHFTNETAPPEGSEPIEFGWTILAHQWNEEPPCEYSVVPTGEDTYPGLYGGTVTPVMITNEDCSEVYALRTDSSQSFQQGQGEGSGAGWAGWSCVESGYSQVVGGGVTPEGADVFAQGPAEFGAPAIDGFNYPVYPHYTFNGGVNAPGGEEGWVVEADGPNPPTGIYNLCAAP